MKQFKNFIDNKHVRGEIRTLYIEYNKENQKIEFVATDSYILIKATYDIKSEYDSFKMKISYEDLIRLINLKGDFFSLNLENKTINDLKIEFLNENYPNYKYLFTKFEGEGKKISEDRISNNFDSNLLYKTMQLLDKKDLTDKFYKMTMKSGEEPLLLENRDRKDRVISILIMPVRI